MIKTGLPMNLNYLTFEQPIADLEAKIQELSAVGSDNNLNISEELSRLREQSRNLTKKIYAKLTPWQIVQVARHPQRPYSSDYIERIFSDFDETWANCKRFSCLVIKFD